MLMEREGVDPEPAHPGDGLKPLHETESAGLEQVPGPAASALTSPNNGLQQKRKKKKRALLLQLLPCCL